ncbi:helix-turn-helix domain-containing protein [Niveibacterium terrae]|uniref:AraC family transcriptional regulator n=1 Tax=Niveibacterium terrae TaxID=3373598 RepID=UPI003A8C9E70
MIQQTMPAGSRQKTVSTALIRMFAGHAARYGLDEAAFCAWSGLSPLALRSGEGRVGAKIHLALQRRMDQLGPRNVEALPFSLDLLYENFPELAALWSVSATPREGVRNYERFRCLIGEVDTVRLTHAPDGLLFDYENEPGVLRSSASALGNFSIVLAILKHLLDTQTMRIELDLQGQAATRQIEALTGARVRGGQARNRLHIHSDALDRPSPQHNPLAARFLLPRVEAKRAELGQANALAARVRAMLLSRMQANALGADAERGLSEVCARMEISRWTLLRRLKDEGQTFASLWGQLRVEEAKRLLVETVLPVGEISARLGFSTQSSLSRFFSGATGMSPARYRACHG